MHTYIHIPGEISRVHWLPEVVLPTSVAQIMTQKRWVASLPGRFLVEKQFFRGTPS